MGLDLKHAKKKKKKKGKIERKKPPTVCTNFTWDAGITESSVV